MNPKHIQYLLNTIAYTALLVYSLWTFIIWLYNPSLTQIQLFLNTWQGLTLMIALALPAIAYRAVRTKDKR